MLVIGYLDVVDKLGGCVMMEKCMNMFVFTEAVMFV